MIGIVDYGMGNLGSVKRKFDRLNIASFISEKPKELELADKLVLPGVGHFANAVKEIRKRDLWEYINHDVVIIKKPILGICLGMQLMANYSEEGECKGFGWIEGEVIRFNIKDTLKFKVPHIGWNQVKIMKSNTIFTNVDLIRGFYFVHSYFFKCHFENDILCESVYESPFTSAIQHNNIYGVQFHPEKSHDPGEQLLKNFSIL
jgi:glutamine amidotransferase